MGVEAQNDACRGGVLRSLGQSPAARVTDLTQVGNNYYFYAHGTTAGPDLKRSGSAVALGQFGDWTPIGAEATGGGYEVVWKNGGADQYTAWNADSSGNYVSNIFPVVAGTDPSLQALEALFDQDLNGDNGIGSPTIANGKTFEVVAAYAGDVTFAGSTGTLKLDQASDFSGTVTSMSGRDAIDLANIDFATVQQPTYTGTSSGGMLCVTDGTHSANAALLGNYLASTFVTSNDGYVGTTIVDPLLVASLQQTPLAHPLHV